MAHLVEVWRLEWAERHPVSGAWLALSQGAPDPRVVLDLAIDLRERDDTACLRVIGPCQQEVPDE